LGWREAPEVVGVALKSNGFWFILLGGVLIISVIAAILVRQAPANRALIYSDGELIRSIELSAVTEKYSFTVNNGSGLNVILVENGRIRVSESNCPDGFCVYQGWVSGGAVPVVCLPHRLVIKLEGGSAPDVDAVAG